MDMARNFEEKGNACKGHEMGKHPIWLEESRVQLWEQWNHLGDTDEEGQVIVLFIWQCKE